MKKIILLLVVGLVVGLSAREIGCKKQDSMFAIAGADDRVALFRALERGGECAVIDSIRTIDYDGLLKKVLAKDGQYYWVNR